METAFHRLLQIIQISSNAHQLTNAPASFQDMMNNILKDLLDKGIVVYIDNILI
jgi:hypothetical protein